MISMSLFAAEAPDIFVKKTADEVFELLKRIKILKRVIKKEPIKLLRK